jgi:hypothetical protein
MIDGRPDGERDCPLCDEDGDQRPTIEQREGVDLCVWHALAYDLNTPTEIRRRVRNLANA